MIGRAAGFNEGDVFVDVGVIEVGTSFSVEAWIKPDSTPQVQETIVLGMQENSDLFAIEFDKEKGLRVRFGDNSSTDYSGYMRFGTKNHVTIVFDVKKEKAIIYMNGKKKAEGSYPNSKKSSSATHFTIGGGPRHTSFRGVIDEFTIYSSALSEKEVRQLYEMAEVLRIEQFDEIPSLNIKKESEVIAKRAELIRYIWKEGAFPHRRIPDTVVEDVQDEHLQSLPNLKRIDRLVVNMDHGLESNIYYFRPVKSNNRLVVYHEGNGKNFTERTYTLGFFLDKGYSVLGLNMPLTGINRKSENLSRLSDPAELSAVESELESMVKYFLEPVEIALNYALMDFDYDSVSMIGFSGGGWITTMYTAIDQRISKSYPVAGTLPLYIRDRAKDLGGFEQRIPSLYNIANYLDIYALGSHGRRQVQILNKYDSCCYAASERTSYIRSYEKEINEFVQESGGSFQVYIDDSERHTMSETVHQMIEKDIRE